MRLAFIVAGSLALSLCSPSAHADEGELYLDGIIAPRISFLDHPSVAKGPFAPQGVFGITPTLGLAARYGVTNSLHLGVGATVTASTALKAAGAEIEGSSGDVLTAAYAELALPLSAGWRFDSGSNMTGVLQLDVAPLLVFWGNNAFADPNDLDENGLPRTFPLTIANTWHVGGSAALSVLFEARIWDAFVFAVGPTVSVSWADTFAVNGGIMLRPSFVTGLGL